MCGLAALGYYQSRSHRRADRTPTPTPLPLFALPDARINRAYTSNTIALAGDGRTMVAANMINNSMTILIPAFDRVIAEMPVGKDPRSVAITPDGTRALVANHGDGTLSVVNLTPHEVVATICSGGVMPYGVVTQQRRHRLRFAGRQRPDRRGRPAPTRRSARRLTCPTRPPD